MEAERLPPPVLPPRPLCRHCRRAPVNRRRGLCWHCYYAPGVRELYPPVSIFGRRGVGLVAGCRPAPPRPTSAPPGTPEKVEVLGLRAALGLSLWHRDDAPFDLA